MVSVYDKVEECSGCGSCYMTCGYHAIEMVNDEDGFLYPKINRDKCKDCDSCKNACPVIQRKSVEDRESEKIAYAARTSNKDILRNSTSGGMSFELGKEIIQRGGVVFGACYVNGLKVEHQIIENLNELYRMQGSKYVQSNIGNTYRLCKEVLKVGRPVLFTGTPCQIEGLLVYLKRDYENLYTQDLICHGVPSPGLWSKYIMENKFRKSADNIVFRDKSIGWETGARFLIENAGKKRYEPLHKNAFYKLFDRNFLLRPICYECPFKSKNKRSDITCADLWGISTILPQYSNDDRGMSLILVNSQKGKALLSAVKARCEIYNISYDKAIIHNMMALKSVTCPPTRTQFFLDAKHMNYKKLAKKYIPRDSVILSLKKKLYPVKIWFVEYLLKK